MLLIFSVAAPGIVFAQEAASSESQGGSAKVPETVINLRTRFGDAETDAQALAIIAGDLIKAKDQEWLRAGLLDPAFPDQAKSAIVSAFCVKRDITALEEILVLSVSHPSKGMQQRCMEAIRNFLADQDTRAPVVKKLLAIIGRNEKPELLELGTIHALGEARDLSAMDTLLPILGHEKEAFRDAAALALRKITLRDFGREDAAWRAWWEKNKHVSRDRLIEPVLQDQLEQAQEAVKRLAEQRIGLALQLMEGAPDRAVGFLGWPETAVRRRAAAVLGSAGADGLSQEVMDKVIAHLEGGETDEETLKRLLELIGRAVEDGAGNAPPKAVIQKYQGILLAYLKNDLRYSVKVVAANSLKGFKGDPVRRSLSKILLSLKGRENSAELKTVLLARLADFENPEEAGLFQDFLGADNEKVVRESAIQSLGKTGSEAAVKVLGLLLVQEPDEEIRFEVARALTRLGKTEGRSEGLKAKAVVALTQGFRARETSVRQQCIIGIGELRPADGLAIIQGQLEVEKNPGVMSWCIWALGSLGDPKGLALIGAALSRPVPENGTSRDLLLKRAREAVGVICKDDQGLWLQIGETFFRDKHFDMLDWCCKEFFKKFKGKNGGDGAHHRVGILQSEADYALSIKANDPKTAAEHARRLAEELDPENNAYLWRYARTLVEMQNCDEAIKVYQRLIGRYPADRAADLWRMKIEAGECLLAKGDASGSLIFVQGFPGGQNSGLPDDLIERYGVLKKKANALIEQAKKPPEKAPKKTPEKPGESGQGDQTGKKEEGKPPESTQKKGEKGTDKEGVGNPSERSGGKNAVQIRGQGLIHLLGSRALVGTGTERH